MKEEKTKIYKVVVREDRKIMGGKPCIYGTRITLGTLSRLGLKKFIELYPYVQIETGSLVNMKCDEDNTKYYYEIEGESTTGGVTN